MKIQSELYGLLSVFVSFSVVNYVECLFTPVFSLGMCKAWV